MKIEKGLTINIGGYESLKLSVSDVDSFETADRCLISELERLEIPVSRKIKNMLKWNED
jgi:hypothetical protein